MRIIKTDFKDRDEKLDTHKNFCPIPIIESMFHIEYIIKLN